MEEILDKFSVKKNYIGQLELLAAALAFFSLPELRHESVFHWIDNTSVLAALIKGYARAHASVRLLHAFKAFAFGLGVDSWFQWVPSKANIADLPSRKEYEMLRRFGAEERPMILPEFEMWDEPIRNVLWRAVHS